MPRRCRIETRAVEATATSDPERDGVACGDTWPLVPARSARAATVARWFGLPSAAGGAADAAVPVAAPEVLDVLRHPAPGTITLVTGPSGSGKSALLRALIGDSHPRVTEGKDELVRWIDAAARPLPDVAVVDCFGATAPLAVVLTLVGRLGLGEAWTYLRTPAELSDGQRWRLRLALALWEATRGTGALVKPSASGLGHPRTTARSENALVDGAPGAAPARVVLVADEFAALLDRVTAAIVARALRRMIEAHPTLAAIVATSHEDLAPALRPDMIVRCDFTTVTVERPSGERAP